MDRADAWMAITKITNKRNVTKADIAEVRRLMAFLPDEQQADLEESLFLIEKAK
jgi:hypothetical protein